MAINPRKREKGPALMTDRAEISVDDETERLLAAVVRMHPPADVRQQARGMAQAAVLVGFPHMYHPPQAIGPFGQVLCVAPPSRQQLGPLFRGADQSVLGALR